MHYRHGKIVEQNGVDATLLLLKRQRERKKSGAAGDRTQGLFFLSLCRFKGLRTVTAQIISIGLRTWVSPVYRAPYAVMKLRFFRNHKTHTAGCRSLVAEHWRLKPEALGSIPGGTTFLSFPLPFQK